MASRKAGGAAETPLRSALRTGSGLRAHVREGIAAVKRADQRRLDEEVRASFEDSLDLDASLRAPHPREHRWDYLLGHARSREIVAIETHSATGHEVRRVIEKRNAALQQLGPHLRDGKRVRHWLWVASGNVQFANTERVRRQLDENGIKFVGRTVRAKDLPTTTE